MRSFTFEDRKKFEALYAAGTSFPDMAKDLGVHLATIYHELAKGTTETLDANGRYTYSAETAQRVYLKNTSRRGRKRKAEKPLREETDNA